jgi:hypothetical protein
VTEASGSDSITNICKLKEVTLSLLNPIKVYFELSLLFTQKAYSLTLVSAVVYIGFIICLDTGHNHRYKIMSMNQKRSILL